jgi:hypothetical protein
MSLYEKKRARTAIPHFDKVVHCHYAIFPFFSIFFFFLKIKNNRNKGIFRSLFISFRKEKGEAFFFLQIVFLFYYSFLKKNFLFILKITQKRRIINRYNFASLILNIITWWGIFVCYQSASSSLKATLFRL